jgi:hypothetical protein
MIKDHSIGYNEIFMTEEKRLEGLGGWLISVKGGIIFNPLFIIIQTFLVYSGLFSDGNWELLTNPGSYAYNQFWETILIGEISVNCGFVLLWIYIGYLFFKKKTLFPRGFIGILLFSLLYSLIDALAVKAVLPSAPIFDPDTTGALVRSFIGILIWVPYMLKSKRVKVTFVN